MGDHKRGWLAHLASPSDTIEPRTSLPESIEPNLEGLLTCCDTIGQLRHKKVFELVVFTSAYKGSDKTSCRCSRDDPREEICIQECFDDTEVV